MNPLHTLSIVLALLLLAACSGGSGASTSNNNNQVTGVDTAPQISVVTAQ
jgi:hypothetical protein